MKNYILALLCFSFLYSCTWKHEKSYSEVKTVTTKTGFIQKPENKNQSELSYYQIQENYLDSLFLTKQHLPKYSLDTASRNKIGQMCELSIGNIFSKTNKNAVFLYLKNDTTLIVKVLEQNNSKWKTILKDSILHFNMWERINDYAFEDFNGDKIPDLKILKQVCNIGSCQEYEAWVYETGSFLKVKNFSAISFDKYNATQNIIYTRSSYGSRSFSFGKYRVNKHVLQKLDITSCYFDETTNECTVTINDKEIKCSRKDAYKIVSKDYSDWVYGLWNE